MRARCPIRCKSLRPGTRMPGIVSRLARLVLRHRTCSRRWTPPGWQQVRATQGRVPEALGRAETARCARRRSSPRRVRGRMRRVPLRMAAAGLPPACRGGICPQSARSPSAARPCGAAGRVLPVSVHHGTGPGFVRILHDRHRGRADPVRHLRPIPGPARCRQAVRGTRFPKAFRPLAGGRVGRRGAAATGALPGPLTCHVAARKPP